MLRCFSHVRLCAILWTIASQAPLSMGFSRQEYWSGFPTQVLFHMHWSEGESRGQVKMRVFAQSCQKCSQPSFEVPEFTEENISRILNNLVLQILKKCYRENPGLRQSRWILYQLSHKEAQEYWSG